MKNENLFIGAKKIQGELLKLGIDISISTIKRIIQVFRKQGKINASLTWKKFIRSHINCLYAMDFFTITTVFGKRLFVFFIIYIKTREIIHFNITTNPTKFFVTQRLMHFTWESWEKEEIKYLIHDNEPAFKYINYSAFYIVNKRISEFSPNMNAYAERFVRSVRKEALDWFIIFSRKQLENILKEYISYYNSKRPHQGINQCVPLGYTPQTTGKIIAEPILSGLVYHYKRKAA